MVRVQLCWLGCLFALFCEPIGFSQTSSPSLNKRSFETTNGIPIASPRWSAQCTPAVPIAFGDNVNVDGDWVTYSRSIPVNFMSPQIKVAGAYNLSQRTDQFPVVGPQATGSVDLFPQLIGHYMFFVRMNLGGSDLILLDIRNPQNFFAVEHAGSMPLFPVPLMLRANGSREFPSGNPDDFVISWTWKSTQAMTVNELHWCRPAECMQANVHSMVIPNGAPGTLAGDRILDWSASSFYADPVSGTPGFVYGVSNGYWGNLYSMFSGLTTNPLLILGPVSQGQAISFYQISGLYMSYAQNIGNQRWESRVTFPQVPVSNPPYSLWKSNPSPTQSDLYPSLSNIPDARGRLLISWLRSDSLGGDPKVMADFIDPQSPFSPGGTLPVEVTPVSWMQDQGYTQCGSSSASGSHIAFSCQSQRYPGVPVVFDSQCISL